MSLAPKLQLRQTQSLVMTPQLAQSIKLLQFSHTELMEYVQGEVEKNPLLELDTNTATKVSEPAEAASEARAEPEKLSTELPTSEAALAEQMDTSFDNVYDAGIAGAELAGKTEARKDAASTPGAGSQTSSTEEFDILSNLGSEPDLTDHLLQQAGMEFHDGAERQIAEHIIHSLDEDGYFREDISEVAKSLNITARKMLDVLVRVQTFDPVGIAARNLSECLALQLRDKDRYDPAMQVLIENLDLLAKREFRELIKLCDVSREDFSDMIEEIKALDPRPAGGFAPVLSEPVVPDVLVAMKDTGEWRIELNPQTLPKVLVDRDYYVELSGSLAPGEGKQFVNDCMESANWLTRSLEQRAQTILKVTAEIVKKQDMFFAAGVSHLKPMTLKAVAEAIDMHESTVSRVTANKYLTCDQGMFELKFFFTSSINSSDGDGVVSAEAVKHQIQRMINAELPTKILSDDQIVKNLQETGIEIARRTVAKYREAMKIASSVQRRREKSGKF